MKILIAEDEPLTAKIAAHILDSAGYKVDVVYDGELAYRQLQQHNYDLVLVDWMMPAMDGIQLVRAIRTELKPVPKIILMSGLNDDQARKHAIESGADAFVAKPFSPNDLISAVDTCMQPSLISEPAPPPPPPALAPAQRLRKTIRPSFPAVCVVGMNQCTCLCDFLTRLPADMYAAVFICFHGSQTPIAELNAVSKLPVKSAEEAWAIEPGNVYVVPPGKHLVILESPLSIHLEDPLPGEFDVHTADILARNIVRTFGAFTTMVALCSPAADGVLGARHISAADGMLIVDATHKKHAGYLAHALHQAEIGARFVERREVSQAVARQVERLLHKTLTQKLQLDSNGTAAR